MGTFDKSPEAEAKRIAALRKRLAGSKCPKGCTCGKHSATTRSKISEARRGRTLSDEHKAKISAASKEMWAKKSTEERREIGDRRWITRKKKSPTGTRYNPKPFDGPPPPPKPRKTHDKLGRKIRRKEDMSPEERQRRSEARKKAHADGKYKNARPGVRRRTSQIEYLLAPYLKALGYRHNHDGYTFIASKVPDFVDIENRRVFEFFGNYWHKDEDVEAFRKHYEDLGWSVEILWEQDTLAWLQSHQELVTGEQHQAALDAVVADPRYRRTHSGDPASIRLLGPGA